MSRLIIKNLPKDIKEERLRSIFSSKGEITDLRLCKTKDGKFRRFGFVGFKTKQEADSAFKFFNNSYIDTAKIQIESARNLGEKSSSRPWSKYSEGSSAYQRNNRQKTELQHCEKLSLDEKSSSKQIKTKSLETNDDLEKDPEFQEFLIAHKSRSAKSLGGSQSINFSRETKNQVVRSEKSKEIEEYPSSDSSDDEQNDSGSSSGPSEGEHKDQHEISKSASNISDMDYLKSKIVSQSLKNVNTDEPTQSNNNEKDDHKKSNNEESQKVVTQQTNPLKPTQASWTLKMRGLPFKLKDKDIKAFFSPLKCSSIRLVKNKKGQPSGRAFVDFMCKDDLEKALKRNKDYLEGRYIELFRDENKTMKAKQDKQDEERPWLKKQNNNEEEDESIGESGRLFLRNLAYSCTEDDIHKLFESHGPLSEVSLPLDKVTSKTIGIGYVTFLMPEHAVKAFNELDGSVFQGRLLHILPSKAKKTEQEISVESSYKKKNEANKKSQSGSNHNWNTLFLGVNAVADAMADKYNTTKRGILDAESSNSLAVRMALGETQIVADTRKFLIENGVKLDVFGQPASKRSKTVVIAKNLPYGTSTDELQTIFAPFGQLQRVILPPTGITALIEFQEPSFARKAFQKLAYSKFKNSLLYLEWAPVDVFVEGSLKEETAPEPKTDNHEEKGEESELDSETEEQDGKILFIKNLNFETTEDILEEKFSQVGKVKSVTIARKKDSKNRGALLSMGYGFVEFRKKSSALKALKELQHCLVDEHALELKLSHRRSNDKIAKKRFSVVKQKSSKILVRNVPFEATTKELRELFSTFGEIKTLRLPKKMAGTGPHRGFAFVDFLTKQDAKRAFEALSTSTHLYGRRLVLEWAEEEDDVETLRKRTAKHFQEPRKMTKKKKEMLDELMDLTEDS